jgi:Ecdysteroid kinase-like family
MTSVVEKFESINKLLSIELFSDIIESKLKLKNFKIDLNLTPLSTVGNNFSSVIYRVKVSVQLSHNEAKMNFNFIAKASLVREWNEDNREIIIYEKLMPEFEKLWIKFSNESLDLTACCFKVIEQPNRVIVLEDLSADGYITLDRKQGMDIAQAKLALKKIARLHSVSALYFQKV